MFPVGSDGFEGCVALVRSPKHTLKDSGSEIEIGNERMLRRTRQQASQTAGKVAAADDPMTRTKSLSRKLLLDRIQSYQSSSALTLDTSSASTNKEDSSSSPTLDPLDNIDPIPTVDLNDVRRRSRHSDGCLKVKSQEESSGMFFGSCRSLEKKSVSWCMVEFQTYDIILGDNPATSRGPPLSIGNVISRSVLPLADYEEHRPPRRAMSDLIIHMMRVNGCSWMPDTLVPIFGPWKKSCFESSSREEPMRKKLCLRRLATF
jgi:hypothetical protein